MNGEKRGKGVEEMCKYSPVRRQVLIKKMGLDAAMAIIRTCLLGISATKSCIARLPWYMSMALIPAVDRRMLYTGTAFRRYFVAACRSARVLRLPTRQLATTVRCDSR